MSNQPAQMHVKLFMFSRSGSSKQVTMTSSGNLTNSSALSQWNNMQTIVGEPSSYFFLRDYFDAMVADKSQPNYARQLTAGIYTSITYPRPESSNSETDPFLGILSNVRCTGATTGYGNGSGRTVIRIAMFGWTTARQSVARKVAALHSQGCIIQILVDRTSVEKEVYEILLKPDRTYGTIALYDVTRPANGIYMHHKYMLIDGKYGKNPGVEHVITGSANFTRTGLRYGNELTLRIADNATHDKFEQNFLTIRNNYAKRITTVPADAQQIGTKTAAPENADAEEIVD